MKLDLTKLAERVRSAHVHGLSLCLPAMTFRELGILSRMLEDTPAQASTLLH